MDTNNFDLSGLNSPLLPPQLPQANPDNSAVVQSMATGQPYAQTIAQQASTPFGQPVGSSAPGSALPSLSSPTASALPPPTSSTKAPSFPTDQYGNDMTDANRYREAADKLQAEREAREANKPKEPPPPSSGPSISLDFSGLPYGNFGDRAKRTQMLNGMLANAAKFGGLEGLNSAKLQMAQYLSANPDKAGRGMFGKNPFANGLI